MRNVLTNWWCVITAILGTTLLMLGVAGVTFGDGGASGFIGAGATLVSGGLILGGLAALKRRVIAGSRMITVGTALTVLSVFLIPVAAIILIGGLWTGQLQLSDKVDEQDLQPVRPPPSDITARWHQWLFAAVFLSALGFGALVVLGDGQTATGEDDTGLINGLAWLTWMFSWLGAVISAGFGVFLGAKRVVVRHRTRPA